MSPIRGWRGYPLSLLLSSVLCSQDCGTTSKDFERSKHKEHSELKIKKKTLININIRVSEISIMTLVQVVSCQKNRPLIG